jgi:branched-chain amino acid transport system permease protein
MFWEQLLNGITLGNIYALVALGYTLVFGVLDIINMAQGELFMVGAFTALFGISVWKFPLWLGFLFAIL